MEMAAVKSPAENEPTDQRKGQEIEDTNTIGGEISHKDEDQEDAEGGKKLMEMQITARKSQ